MMRRNVRTFVKLLLVALLAVISTMITLRLLGPAEDLRSQSLPSDPLKVFAVTKEAGAHPENPVTEMSRRKSGRIDWHDHAQIKADSLRIGPGEQGQSVVLKPEDEHEKEELYKVNGFNALASDKMSLNRSLPDIRHPGCKTKKYLAHLPDVSVVVPFHNEHLSTLLRTAMSAIYRAPPGLVREVILVDDFSNKDILRKPLEDYINKHLPRVRVLRLPERSGLILARLAGAREAKGEVLVFLDSHTECNVNWLPPLLDPIALDYKTCVCPFIDVLDFDTFQYRAQDEGARGAFDWEFFYKRLPLLPEDLKNPTEPFKSPVMAGGLFAISARFFWELGGYDPGLMIWGGEQYELSFKIWQCGGQMVDAPCSRIGHVYRKFAPFPNPHSGTDFVGKNYMRVATVWMDEYKEYLLKRRPQYRKIDPGDLTDQFAVRKRLNCKPFKWFMTEVAFDLPLKYPPIEPPDFASGKIRSLAIPDYCVDTKHHNKDETVILDKCGQSGNSEQEFVLSWHKDVRPKGRSMCWDVPSASEKRSPVKLWGCHGMQGNQFWRYYPEKKQLVHGGNRLCLDCDRVTHELFVTGCEDGVETQKWEFEKPDLKALANWDNAGPK
ncbi:Hypothetical predicted protein [Cloeon dipterum]|uniref:Polypeptide N-acetylgalactosaminyltransferase n=1 Tax=Cloeon dipterum TaxID=197152 RepID=A0A8S1D3B0_9INSE|nr:Hypothetical predicted protein [Cloeon dipterum]